MNEDTIAQHPSCNFNHHDHSRREFLRLLGLTSLAPFASHLAFAQATPGTEHPKYYGAFTELPVGTIKPQGWTKQFLIRQAAGLSGHPENMAYPYDTCMLAGVIPPPAVKHGQI